MTDAAIACMRATPQYAGYCRAQGYGQGSPGGVDQMLAFYGGVCDSTVCGLVDMALHPDQAAVGLVIAAANGLSPGLVDAVAPDYSRRAQMTNLAARMHSADPAESARAQGQVAGMVLALLLPFKALRGAKAAAVDGAAGLTDGPFTTRPFAAGDSRSYIDLTRGGQIRNVGTDATHVEFSQTLADNGWVSYPSGDRRVQVFTSGGARYVLRSTAASYGGWSADFYPPGGSRITLKLRLGYGQ
jgi:hypothetical protein